MNADKWQTNWRRWNQQQKLQEKDHFVCVCVCVCELVQFHILKSPRQPLILGYPWLCWHNPNINWETGVIREWGTSCHLTCLKQASLLLHSPSASPSPDLYRVTPEYHNLRLVFSKTKATSLPPHWPYDCTIDLLPGTLPPKGRLYLLSAPERKAMKTYINDSLAAGLIRPPSSPARVGFFFVEKKVKTLRPCIDYRGLNDITIKNCYPPPLISSAFELLQGATIITKLDFRNAYHLVHIREGDEWKMAFNAPSGHYEYLVGLTNAPAIFQALVNDVLRTCSIALSSSTSMTSWYSPRPRKSISIMSSLCSSASSRTPCLSKQKNVSSTLHLSRSWGTS